jgi:hypothetical protein
MSVTTKKMRGLRLAGLVVACQALALWPAPAAAQITAPREGAEIEFGPLSVYPSLQIVDAGIDENVFNDAGEARKDYTFTVASRALAVLRVGSNEIMFLSGSDYVWFRKYVSERSGNATYAVRLNLTASRFKPFLGAERTRTRARPNAEIDARARRLEQRFLAGASFDLTERTAITTLAEFNSSSYQDGERFRGVTLDDALNRSGRIYSGGVRYAVTPLTNLSISGNYREAVFSQSHIRDSKSYSVTPLVEFSPDAAIRGRFSAGYEVFKPADRALPEHKGVVTEGALNWSVASMTTFDLGVARNVSYSYQDTEPYYLQTGGRLAVTQRLFGPLSLVGSVDRQVLSYRWRRGGIPTLGSEDRTDVADTLSGGLSVSLGRGFAVLVGAEKTRRHSSEDARQNFNRTRLLSTVTVGK